MRDLEHPPQGGGQAVDRPQPGVGQDHPAAAGGERHPGPGGQVLRLPPGPLQGGPGRLQPLPGEAVGKGVGPGGEEALQELGEGVQPRLGGLPLRQAQGQLRVHQGQAGEEEGAAQADLGLFLPAENHGVAGGFRAGPGRGGKGVEGQGRVGQGLAFSHPLQVIENLPGVGQQGSRRLAGVEHASAPETQHRLDFRLPGQL